MKNIYFVTCKVEGFTGTTSEYIEVDLSNCKSALDVDQLITETILSIQRFKQYVCKIESVTFITTIKASAKSKLEKEHGELKEALEAFCKFHEHNASWDKTGSVYYNAKKVLNRINDVEDGIK